ncbi:MAG TPA: hypothetical protein VN841_12670 [Bryobacteraceae bacterium]|nr:hypothetical protein [Bryobacteraceae bacterium]
MRTGNQVAAARQDHSYSVNDGSIRFGGYRHILPDRMRQGESAARADDWPIVATIGGALACLRLTWLTMRSVKSGRITGPRLHFGIRSTILTAAKVSSHDSGDGRRDRRPVWELAGFPEA